jgi:hypothetical protein
MATFTTPKSSRKARGENRNNYLVKSQVLTPPVYDLELATYHRHLQVQTANVLMGQFYNGELTHHSAAALAMRGGTNGGINSSSGGCGITSLILYLDTVYWSILYLYKPLV